MKAVQKYTNGSVFEKPLFSIRQRMVVNDDDDDIKLAVITFYYIQASFEKKLERQGKSKHAMISIKSLRPQSVQMTSCKNTISLESTNTKRFHSSSSDLQSNERHPSHRNVHNLPHVRLITISVIQHFISFRGKRNKPHPIFSQCWRRDDASNTQIVVLKFRRRRLQLGWLWGGLEAPLANNFILLGRLITSKRLPLSTTFHGR